MLGFLLVMLERLRIPVGMPLPVCQEDVRVVYHLYQNQGQIHLKRLIE
jgi:hypothetical protein